MASYNKVFLTGNLTRNPEIRYTNNQTAICSFGIAVNQGTREKPDTYFGECVCFGKTAESFRDSPEKVPPFWLRASLRMSNGRTEKPVKHGAKHGFMFRI